MELEKRKNIHPIVYKMSNCLSICQSVFLFVYLPFYLSICIYICLFLKVTCSPPRLDFRSISCSPGPTPCDRQSSCPQDLCTAAGPLSGLIRFNFCNYWVNYKVWKRVLNRIISLKLNYPLPPMNHCNNISSNSNLKNGFMIFSIEHILYVTKFV